MSDPKRDRQDQKPGRPGNAPSNGDKPRSPAWDPKGPHDGQKPRVEKSPNGDRPKSPAWDHEDDYDDDQRKRAPNDRDVGRKGPGNR